MTSLYGRHFVRAIVGILALPTLAAAQTIPIARADVNRDCAVNKTDATLVQSLLGRRTGQAGFSAAADVNSDGVINNTDLTFVTRNVGAVVCPPANRPPVITSSPLTQGTLLVPYSYQVTASDPDLNPIAYALTAAPPGMTI